MCYKMSLTASPTTSLRIELNGLSHRPDLRGDKCLPWRSQHSQENQPKYPLSRGAFRAESKAPSFGGPLLSLKLSHQRSQLLLSRGGGRKGQEDQKCLVWEQSFFMSLEAWGTRVPQVLGIFLGICKRMRINTLVGRVK